MTTIMNFAGAETGGIEEASSIENNVTVVDSGVVPPRSGTFSYEVDDNESITFSNEVTQPGGDYIIGFGIRITDKTPTTAAFLMSARIGNIIQVLLELETNGDITVEGVIADLVLFTVSDPLTINTWHYFELYFQHSDTGNVELFIDGVSVGSSTGDDMLNGTAGTVDNVKLLSPLDVGQFVYYDDIYFMGGATSPSDRIGGNNINEMPEIFKYQSVKASATPDDGGTVLDAGTWDRAGETPLASTATNPEYESAGAGAVDTDATNGSPEGPANDSRIDGDSNIKAAKAVCNMKRSGGPGSDHFILFGNDVDGTTRSPDLNPSVSFDNFFFISEAATIVPLSTEHFRIGFETTGAQDFECREQWAMILHVPSAAVARRAFIISE